MDVPHREQDFRDCCNAKGLICVPLAQLIFTPNSSIQPLQLFDESPEIALIGAVEAQLFWSAETFSTA
jgi:hypothetical protein